MASATANNALDPQLRGQGADAQVSPTYDATESARFQPRDLIGGAYDDIRGEHVQYASASPNDSEQQHDDGSASRKRDADELDASQYDINSADAKKSRACEACRGLKVRCEPEPTSPDGPCKRCTKAGRSCVVTQPTRKRQKKTDSRVAELEKKIDALTATLSAAKAEPPAYATPGSTPAAADYGSLERAAAWGSRYDHGRADRSAFGGIATSSPTSYNTATPTSAAPNTSPRDRHQPLSKNRHSNLKQAATDSGSFASRDQRETQGGDYVDVMDRGFLSHAKANALWERYITRMVPNYPAVVFSPSTTADDVRKSKPVLFLAIMAAASSECPNTIQQPLTKELMQILADKIVVKGEKSMQLIQALCIAVIWYKPPENMEELKFYQLVHMAAVMGLDIGLGRPKQKMGPSGFMPQYGQKNKTPIDPTGIEARRTWLVCYFLAMNTSITLRRPALIRWSTFLADSMNVLETSPEAAPTDKYLCCMIWTHKIGEDIGTQFSMDDPSAFVNISDTRIQYAVKGFEHELDKYQRQLAAELKQPTLIFALNVLSLYVHELALQQDPSENLTGEIGENIGLTPAHVNALSECVTAINKIHGTFLSMDVADIRCLPVFNYVRVAYATVVLVRIYFAAAKPGSELGKIVDKDNMNVETQLDELLAKFKATAKDDKSRPAAKFLMVLLLVKTWFQKQKKAIELQPDKDDATKTTTQDRSRSYSATANTPLQLLSEVATKDHAASNGNKPTAATSEQEVAKMIPGPWMGQTGSPYPYTMPMGRTAVPEANVGATNNLNAAGNDNAIMSMPPTANLQVGGPAPWLNASFDMDYSGVDNGIAQAAVDYSMGVMPDGSTLPWQEFGMYEMMGPADNMWGSMMGDVGVGQFSM